MTNIGNKAPGGGSVVSATPTSITIDGVTTTFASSDPTDNGTKLYNIARSLWELKRAGVGYFPSVADNGSGKIRITCVGHGLITGDSIDIHGSSVAGYNGTALSVTRIGADTFDIPATAYSATATGYWKCASNVFKAADQDGAWVQGAVVRSLYTVNLPQANPGPTIVTCSQLIRAEYGGILQSGYNRSPSDPVVTGLNPHDFVRTAATGEINFYNQLRDQPSGCLYRIDYVA
jgi:hypothetical protein